MFSILTSNAKMRTVAETKSRNRILPAVPRRPPNQLPRYSPTFPLSSFVPGKNSSPALRTPKKAAKVSPIFKSKFFKE
jgi:hypothetical protein